MCLTAVIGLIAFDPSAVDTSKQSGKIQPTHTSHPLPRSPSGHSPQLSSLLPKRDHLAIHRCLSVQQPSSSPNEHHIRMAGCSKGYFTYQAV